MGARSPRTLSGLPSARKGRSATRLPRAAVGRNNVGICSSNCGEAELAMLRLGIRERDAADKRSASPNLLAPARRGRPATAHPPGPRGEETPWHARSRDEWWRHRRTADLESRNGAPQSCTSLPPHGRQARSETRARSPSIASNGGHHALVAPSACIAT